MTPGPGAALATLTVLPAGVEVLLPRGSRLTELEYETAARLVPFGCRSGACGACVIEVVAGGEALGQPDLDELDFLADLGRTSDHRLACQCRLHGDVTIRVADS